MKQEEKVKQVKKKSCRLPNESINQSTRILLPLQPRQPALQILDPRPDHVEITFQGGLALLHLLLDDPEPLAPLLDLAPHLRLALLQRVKRLARLRRAGVDGAQRAQPLQHRREQRVQRLDRRQGRVQRLDLGRLLVALRRGGVGLGGRGRVDVHVRGVVDGGGRDAGRLRGLGGVDGAFARRRERLGIRGELLDPRRQGLDVRAGNGRRGGAGARGRDGGYGRGTGQGACQRGEAGGEVVKGGQDGLEDLRVVLGHVGVGGAGDSHCGLDGGETGLEGGGVREKSGGGRCSRICGAFRDAILLRPLGGSRRSSRIYLRPGRKLLR